jgi:hypothetical protein
MLCIIPDEPYALENITQWNLDDVQMIKQYQYKHVGVKGRKNSKSAPEIKFGETDVSRPLIFANEQSGNKKSADDKKDRDSQCRVANEHYHQSSQGAVGKAVSTMTYQDQSNRDGAQPVE